MSKVESEAQEQTANGVAAGTKFCELFLKKIE